MNFQSHNAPTLKKSATMWTILYSSIDSFFAVGGIVESSDIISSFMRKKKLAAIAPSIMTFLLLLHVAGINEIPTTVAIGFSIFVLANLILAALLKNKFVTRDVIDILCPKCKKPMHTTFLRCDICGTETKLGEEDNN